MHPPDGPPVCTALTVPPGAPPPMSSTIVRRDVPSGTSTSPVWTTLPVRQNTLVPLLFSVPMAANHSGPRRTMAGTLANVSTLLSRVGMPQPALGGVRRAGGRGAALAHDGRHQRRLLAAHECPGP